MRFKKVALAALVAIGASAQAADVKEVLCHEPPRVEGSRQAELQKEFKDIAALAALWTTARPIPEPCHVALAGTYSLFKATQHFNVEFVTERPALCQEGTTIKTRDVDATNDPINRQILVWEAAWKDALDYEKQLITTHELAGVAGQINEPWTTSICWMFVPLLPGVYTDKAYLEQLIMNLKSPVMFLAEGGGGSTGIHGGGDVKMAGYKFRALRTMLDESSKLDSCGLTTDESTTAFSCWLSEEVRDPNAWKSGEREILIHTLELGKGRTATDDERRCLVKSLL